MRISTLACVAALSAALAFTAACASDSSEDATVAASPHIDLHDLDVGSFVTTSGKVGSPNPARARMVEGQRLGSVAPLAMEIDPRFKYQTGHEDNSVYAWLDPDIAGIRSDDFEADAAGFIAGFFTWGRSELDLGIAQNISYSVLLFSDSDSATHAAHTLYGREIDFQQHVPFSGDTYPHGPVTVDGHPDILAWSTYDGGLKAFEASGRFVVHTSVDDQLASKIHQLDMNELIDLTTKSMSTITARMATFQPTPPDKLTSVPVDHEDILGRTLRRSPTDNWKDTPGFYDRHGALHLSSSPSEDQRLFAETGMDWMAYNGGRLYRAKDAASAQKILDAHSSLGKMYRLMDAPKNLPAARCYEYHGDGFAQFRFECFVRYNEFVAEISSNQLIDIPQRTSAQYAILENPK